MLISGTHRPYFNWLCNISPLYPSVLGAWALSSSPPRFSGSSLAPFYMTTRIEMVCTKASSWIRQTFHVTHTARRSYQGVLMTSSYPPVSHPFIHLTYIGDILYAKQACTILCLQTGPFSWLLYIQPTCFTTSGCPCHSCFNPILHPF